MKEQNEITRKVIVIGASAGGLTPLTQLIKNLKIDNFTSVIIAMHMSQSHNSYLADIIAKVTKYSVTQAQKGARLETKHIYIAPPNRHLVIDDFHFSLIDDNTTPQPNINILLESVASLNSVIPIGVILSGNGNDGTKGLLSFKTQGGLTFVQEPNLAEYPSMPNSAIDSDAADFVLCAEEIGSAISKLIKKNQFPNISNQSISEQNSRGISAILEFLFHHSQIDLHNYKSTSLRRRIYRRVALGGFANTLEYLEFIKQDSNELEQLINDIFISVTQFMRDPQVWLKARELVINYLEKNPTKLLRIWSVGCSTGEEAYSWAILLEEIKSQLQTDFDYMIFATDVSEKSIAYARRGIYDISIIDHLESSLVERYFTKNQYGYQVERHIRDKIVFSMHNILLDPPFSNMHFLSCRNVLIYFNQKLQKRAFANFSYSLVEQGFLLLGLSESVGQKQKYFFDYDKDNKVFQRTKVASTHHIFSHPVQKKVFAKSHISNKKKQENQLLQIVQAKVADYTGYSAILVDEKDDILFTYGDADPLLNLKSGRFSQCLFDILDKRYRAPLQALILKCRRTRTPVRHIEKFKEIGLLLYAVLPVTETDDWLVIVLNKLTESDLKEEVNLSEISLSEINISESKLFHELEEELNSTRLSLHTVVDELEQTNDALQSSNEELQSSNEELQATNEELQTTNEELQSSNEELRTVNDELRLKNTELDIVSNHLQSVEENLETPYILLSTKLEVLRFSKTIDLFSKADNIELNIPFADIPWLKPDSGLRKSLSDAAFNVLNDQQTRVLSGYKINECRYDIAVKHYADSQHRFSEIMLVFNDVTNRFNLTEQVLGDFNKREQILNLLETGLIYTDINGIIKYVNPEATRFINNDMTSFVGEHLDRLLYVYINDESKYPVAGLFQRMTDATFAANSIDNQTFIIKATNGNLTIRLNANPTKNDDEIEAWLFEIHDLSHQTELTLQIAYSDTHDSLTGLNNRRALEERIANFNDDDDNPCFAYALIDVDHFKPINDIAGHLCGDEALKLISLNISQCIEAQDLLSRIGGDEFALLLINKTKPQVKELLNTIIKTINALELETAEGLFNVSVSIGWCYIENEIDINISQLYSHTDEALYLAKKAGGNTQKEILISESNHVHSSAAITFEKIKYAFKHDLVIFAFQPIINLNQNNAHYFELLVRIKLADEFLSPADFMPVVDRYNFTRQFDRYVFRKALKTICDIQQTITEPLHFAINLSASAIDYPDVFDILSDFPQIIGSRNTKITLEITETAAISDLFQAKRFIERAQNLGLKVSLDDFGVGFNGFHYLKELKVDTVKIDGSFINGIVDNQVDRIFVKSVIELAKVLNFNTVAEFVDNQQKYDLINQLGFNYSQGYLHSKPLFLAELYQYLSD